MSECILAHGTGGVFVQRGVQPFDFEETFLELNLRKQKFLLFSGYRSEHEVYGLSKADFFLD